MSRLRHRLARAAYEDPRGLAGSLARYVALRRSLREALSREPLDDLLRKVDGRRRRRTIDPDVLRAGIELGDALLDRTRARADTCLHRALARYAVCRDHGAAATLVIGVEPSRVHQARDDIGHAWVEVEGVALPPEAVDAFTESLRHPTAPRVDRSLWS
ncbi:MAG: lasso peptide biosynthesis B2 protein [Deltaproteobacteria bacterium]|nr:lasso peptide biosynthesis B2 protein [Deltaproteobacteria bacterium]